MDQIEKVLKALSVKERKGEIICILAVERKSDTTYK